MQSPRKVDDVLRVRVSVVLLRRGVGQSLLQLAPGFLHLFKEFPVNRGETVAREPQSNVVQTPERMLPWLRRAANTSSPTFRTSALTFGFHVLPMVVRATLARARTRRPPRRGAPLSLGRASDETRRDETRRDGATRPRRRMIRNRARTRGP